MKAQFKAARAVLPLLSALSISCSKGQPTESRQASNGALGGKAPLTAGAQQTETTGVTDKELVLGEPAAFTGKSAGLGIELWRGATAAFSTANDAGGVQGRRVRLVLRDDGYDAEKAASAVNCTSGHSIRALSRGNSQPSISAKRFSRNAICTDSS